MNIPNALSILRILLIPVYCCFFLADPEAGRWALNPRIIAALVLFLSGITDVLDGGIARKFNMITRLGRILDPLADKLTQATVAVTLAIRNPNWLLLPVLYIGKELLQIIGGVTLIRKFKDIAPSRWFGKVSTATFYFCTLLLILFPDMSPIAAGILLTALIATLMFSLFMYLPLYFRYRSGQRQMNAESPETSSDGFRHR